MGVVLVLALDTSTTVRVALARPAAPGDGGHGGDVVLAARTETDPRRHVELLAPAVAAVLEQAGAARSQITHVVVGTGPAPFTGLRVGVVTALVLAEALGVPVGGLCSLDAVAATALDRAGASGPAELLAATDAKRREVHWARYAVHDVADPFGGWERVDGPHVGPAAQLPDLPVVGDLDPGVLASLAVHRLVAGLPLEAAAPRYLRRPDARPLPTAQ